ncbi:gas vesicle protein GvpG [Archangium gephyra]|uniref:Gas vesicle protein GvpG n=1 Tax=Archangium gephyra TaxID=48 RepID=A0AAC8Q5W8_9BACT|nr:gas vesicle protein GvpG [Archangium gephyra]AKJ01653.1 putative gas vesicle protein GvpG [Archangium gephyra]REG34466.1 gas vesicle protein GvpG [Archangium gephyra]
MLLIDDILFAPLHGLLWVARKVDEAMGQEQEQEEEALKARLRELYLQLESGQLAEEEFEAREAELLDRLEAILASQEAAEAAEDEEERAA